MSWALCFNCGEVKFGALCECEKCGIASTGNTDLDILFSDWNMSENSKVDDKDIHQWLFLAFVTLYYPELFTVEMSDRNIEDALKFFEALNIVKFDFE